MQTTSTGPEEIVRSFNRCHGAFYQVSEGDLLWNLREQRIMRYWRGELDGVPVLWGEAAPEGVGLGISPKGLWLSLFGEISGGREASFASAAEAFARQSGKTRLAVCSDEFHFLPGIPVGEPPGRNLAEAFKARGFLTADCADFVGEPGAGKCATYCDEAEAEARRRDWTLREVKSESEKAELSAFLAREFSGRWLREWKVWGMRQDTARAFWNLLRDEKQEVIGFSRLARRGRHLPLHAGWTPGALRLPLAPGSARLDTDSCLGPIGISVSERGRGAGKILLGLSLRELVLQGAKRTCIDWTNAYNYYTPLGFEIVRRYLSVWKEL
jgi:hypothetical protein